MTTNFSVFTNLSVDRKYLLCPFDSLLIYLWRSDIHFSCETRKLFRCIHLHCVSVCVCHLGAPLFDSSSNFTDPQTMQLLQHCQRLLGNLSTIFHCLLSEAQELTQKGTVFT